MVDPLVYELPEPSRLALSSAGRDQDVWLAPLALDARLGGIVLAAEEPLMAQLRLAWWRDQLAKPVAQRERSDAVIAAIERGWSEQTTALGSLVDGWEGALGDPPDWQAFVVGRVEAGRAIAERLAPNEVEDAARAARFWALADVASRFGDDAARDWALADYRRLGSKTPSLPRALRPLAVLGGLARRALHRGGKPMIGDRLSPLAAMRLGLFGV